MLDSIRDCMFKAFLVFVALVACVLFFGFEAASFLLIACVVFWVARRVWALWRLWKSVASSRGDEAAMALEKLRFHSSLLRLLCNVVVVAVFVLALWLCLDAGLGGGSAALAALIIACLCGLPLWIKATRLWERYTEGFKSGFVAASLSGVFDKLTYEPDGEFNRSDLESLDFFEHFDQFGGNDLIEAEYKGIRFVQGDVRVQERYTVTTKGTNGTTRTSTRLRTVFFGRAMRFDFADAFRGPVRVVQKDFAGAKVGSSPGWTRVETELAEFALDFDIFARDPIDAMAVLTPMMVEGIFYLYHKLECPIAFAFSGNAMFAVFPLKRDSFDVSTERTLREEREHLERDISVVTGFLDTMYFKRQAASGAEAAEGGTARSFAPAPKRDAFAPSPAVEAARIRRTVAAGVWTTSRIVFHVVFAAYILSLAYAIYALPNGIALGFSYSNGVFTLHEASFSIYVYVLLINGFFVLPPSAAACFGSKSLAGSVAALIPMALHFLVLYCNIVNS